MRIILKSIGSIFQTNTIQINKKQIAIIFNVLLLFFSCAKRQQIEYHGKKFRIGDKIITTDSCLIGTKLGTEFGYFNKDETGLDYNLIAKKNQTGRILNWRKISAKDLNIDDITNDSTLVFEIFWDEQYWETSDRKTLKVKPFKAELNPDYLKTITNKNLRAKQL